MHQNRRPKDAVSECMGRFTVGDDAWRKSERLTDWSSIMAGMEPGGSDPADSHRIPAVTSIFLPLPTYL